MRILETPDVKGWRQELGCSNCGTRVEVEASDLHKVSDPRDGDYATCRCPTCNHSLTLTAALIPKGVWAQLKP
jgi:transcription elongation factor Elf1